MQILILSFYIQKCCDLSAFLMRSARSSRKGRDFAQGLQLCTRILRQTFANIAFCATIK